jgi:transcriptional regulator with XRE-family HTH domain
MNDVQVGRVARALRHRLGLRQVDVAARARSGHDVVSRLERGRLDGLTLRTLRRLLAVFDADVAITIRWRGGEVDRILDRRHGGLAAIVAERLQRLGWIIVPEISFSEYGERGSIDMLAWQESTRTLLVIEIKTEITSVEETIRRHDVKWRLAAKVAHQRLGWTAAAVARLLVLPNDSTPRRQVERYETVFSLAYPTRGRPVWAWLADPTGPISALAFVSAADGPRRMQRMTPIRRVRDRRASIPGDEARALAARSPVTSHLIGG